MEISSVVIGDHTEGEGSSREHAAMEPRHLGVCAVIVKSLLEFMKLKKQGVLALTFLNESDYDKIQEDDSFDFIDLENFSPDKNLTIRINHKNDSFEEIQVRHTYNDSQTRLV